MLMGDLARVIILVGVSLVIIGFVMLAIPKLPFLGKLPGDILIKRENFTFSFPLTTSILISLIISLILYLFNKFR
jgi:uncharacterized protein HemY